MGEGGSRISIIEEQGYRERTNWALFLTDAGIWGMRVFHSLRHACVSVKLETRLKKLPCHCEHTAMDSVHSHVLTIEQGVDCEKTRV